ncbi:Cof-type HAD-IIB family hydrolase [Schaalia sp. 19OD2882]|uniref:Cof-type HAD-IIB family hydrolase n=1 Tax=Schaalia sp. 19OD2882 TaxID=2794089 RepID=UPI001C1F084E|nr:Cof-type HAD-IIB family hydrolase [Schaalia sp. 19OD2882]QWW20419.1 Cof-type HAD-IIB family hydrolase [Schaalia sp. 19OD2882]
MRITPDSRLVFVDIDGTLVDHHQQVPASAARACRAAVEGGHRLLLCSGRSAPEIYPRMWEHGFSGLVAGGGAHVLVDGATLLDTRIQADDIRTIDSYLASLGAIWIWQGPDAMHPSRGFMEQFLEKMSAAGATSSWEEYATSVGPHLRSGLPETSSKVTVYVPVGHSSIDEVRAALPSSVRMVPGSVHAATTFVVEIMPRGVSKGAAIELVAAHLAVPMSHTVALGDSHNDIEALTVAGVGVAMGGCAPEVMEAADRVTTGVTEDGLARAFVDLGLAPATVLDQD